MAQEIKSEAVRQDANGAEKPAGWSPFLVLRPPRANQGDTVLLSDSGQLKRALIKRTALLDLVASTFRTPSSLPPLGQHMEDLGFMGKPPEAEVAAHAAHWWQRGWHPSLDYYLWSRQYNYRDEQDTSGEKRKEVLRTYLESWEPPERVKPLGEEHALPKPPQPPKGVSLGELLMNRRTIRSYVKQMVADSMLSSILWTGLEEARSARRLPKDDPLNYLKSYGVAFDFYLVLYSVEGLPPGVYFYDVSRHLVVEMKKGDYREKMVHHLSELKGPTTAAWTIILTADFVQYQWRYRHERALRHMYVESGRIAQRLLMMAMGYGLGTLPTPAVRDKDIAALLGLNERRQAPIYTLTMGLDRRFSGEA